ncbi:hypothetical protein DO97_15605 [Neosynechococcus sphagnicola sy1]|uniref:RSAM-associated Gly-rich repeat protein n=1 Tax=Neosynechococcus sphagnicola sy1 TaxID=1497020 RepID=A0A098TGT4_9CYAN|nr:GrrA/OscA1 family cyclophane-containing rSAM-modified RiPP [Neosynechococcus sphagnicola]KGF71805.1 hypothetical protein DO97_15605 [Neosynechococcus sphagnicola sy1]
MKISTTSGLVGFLLTLSALHPPEATAALNQSSAQHAPPTIEARLTAITAALRSRETQLPEAPQTLPFDLKEGLKLAWGNWGNWRNGSWRNGGWRDWRNGWRDGGGFVNFRNW